MMVSIGSHQKKAPVFSIVRGMPLLMEETGGLQLVVILLLPLSLVVILCIHPMVSFGKKTTQGSCFGNGGGDAAAYGVAYGKDENDNDLWVAVGDNFGGGSAYGNIQYSKYGGVSWEPTFEGGSFFSSGKAVAYGNNRWVAVGSNGADKYGNIMWSTNGTCWVATTEGASFFHIGGGVAYGKDENDEDLWVAVGDNTTAGPGPGGAYGNILYSRNGGVCWIQTSEGDSFAIDGRGVAYSSEQKLWVAVGYNNGGAGGDYGNIMWSTNGTCWVATTEGASFPSIGYGVAFKS